MRPPEVQPDLRYGLGLGLRLGLILCLRVSGHTNVLVLEDSSRIKLVGLGLRLRLERCGIQLHREIATVALSYQK